MNSSISRKNSSLSLFIPCESIEERERIRVKLNGYTTNWDESYGWKERIEREKRNGDEDGYECEEEVEEE